MGGGAKSGERDGRWQKLVKSFQSSSTAKTRSLEQSIVGHETQWTQPWLRVQSRVDVIHLVRSTGAIMSSPHLQSVKNCPEKSKPIKYGGQMHGLMIAIEYSHKLDRKNFNLWCELRRFLLRKSHIYIYAYDSINKVDCKLFTNIFLLSVIMSYKYIYQDLQQCIAKPGKKYCRTNVLEYFSRIN